LLNQPTFGAAISTHTAGPQLTVPPVPFLQIKQ